MLKLWPLLLLGIGGFLDPSSRVSALGIPTTKVPTSMDTHPSPSILASPMLYIPRGGQGEPQQLQSPPLAETISQEIPQPLESVLQSDSTATTTTTITSVQESASNLLESLRTKISALDSHPWLSKIQSTASLALTPSVSYQVAHVVLVVWILDAFRYLLFSSRIVNQLVGQQAEPQGDAKQDSNEMGRNVLYLRQIGVTTLAGAIFVLLQTDWKALQMGVSTSMQLPSTLPTFLSNLDPTLLRSFPVSLSLLPPTLWALIEWSRGAYHRVGIHPQSGQFLILSNLVVAGLEATYVLTATSRRPMMIQPLLSACIYIKLLHGVNLLLSAHTIPGLPSSTIFLLRWLGLAIVCGLSPLTQWNQQAATASSSLSLMYAWLGPAMVGWGLMRSLVWPTQAEGVQQQGRGRVRASWQSKNLLHIMAGLYLSLMSREDLVQQASEWLSKTI